VRQKNISWSAEDIYNWRYKIAGNAVLVWLGAVGPKLAAQSNAAAMGGPKTRPDNQTNPNGNMFQVVNSRNGRKLNSAEDTHCRRCVYTPSQFPKHFSHALRRNTSQLGIVTRKRLETVPNYYPIKDRNNVVLERKPTEVLSTCDRETWHDSYVMGNVTTRTDLINWLLPAGCQRGCGLFTLR